MQNAVCQIHTGLRDRLIRLADRALDVSEEDLLRRDEFGLENASKAQNVLKMLGIHNFTLPSSDATPPPESKLRYRYAT